MVGAFLSAPWFSLQDGLVEDDASEDNNEANEEEGEEKEEFVYEEKYRITGVHLCGLYPDPAAEARKAREQRDARFGTASSSAWDTKYEKIIACLCLVYVHVLYIK